MTSDVLMGTLNPTHSLTAVVAGVQSNDCLWLWMCWLWSAGSVRLCTWVHQDGHRERSASGWHDERTSA